MKSLHRKDNQIVDITYFDNIKDKYVECFVIERLNFENFKNTKDISKNDIIKKIYKTDKNITILGYGLRMVFIPANWSKSMIFVCRVLGILCLILLIFEIIQTYFK